MRTCTCAAAEVLQQASCAGTRQCWAVTLQLPLRRLPVRCACRPTTCALTSALARQRRQPRQLQQRRAQQQRQAAALRVALWR
jgi:hypothetical protein